MRGKLLALRRAAGEATSVSDTALVAAVALGDTAALGTLFDLYHRPVERFVARLSFCDADALADLVQMTFIEVQRSARRFAGKSSVKTWIFGIAANLARHHARGESRRRALLADAGLRPAAVVSGPEDTASHRQLLGRLERALAALPADLRAAFVLCDLEEMPGAQAAQTLRIREGTLWWRLHMARGRLRAAVAGETP